MKYAYKKWMQIVTLFGKSKSSLNLIYFFSSCNVCGYCEPNSLRLIPRVAQICSQMKKSCSAVGTIRFTWITEGFHSLSCCQRELAIQQTGFLPKLTLRAIKSPTSYNISHMRTHYKLIGEAEAIFGLSAISKFSID